MTRLRNILEGSNAMNLYRLIYVIRDSYVLKICDANIFVFDIRKPLAKITLELVFSLQNAAKKNRTETIFMYKIGSTKKSMKKQKTGGIVHFTISLFKNKILWKQFDQISKKL